MKHRRRGFALFLVLVLLLCAVFPAAVGAAPVPEPTSTGVPVVPSDGPEDPSDQPDSPTEEPSHPIGEPSELPTEGPDHVPYVTDNGGFPKTVRAFLAQLPLDDYQTAKLFDGEQECALDAYIATGRTLRVYDFDETLVRNQLLVVMGDVTGSGMASLTQVTRIASAFAGKQPLEGVYLQAADLSGSGTIDLTDIVIAAEEMKAVSAEEKHEVTSEVMPLYIGTSDNESQATVYFFDGQDVPYVSTPDIVALLTAALNTVDPAIQVEADDARGILTLVRENNAVGEIDTHNDSIVFTDMNQFYEATFATSLIDILSISDLDTEAAHYFVRSLGSFSRTGGPLYIPVEDYDIDLIGMDDMTYMPLQTVSDVLLAYAHCEILYNGEMIALTEYGDIADLDEMYYDVPTGKRSAALAEFTYNEFCMALDMFYGLKEQHDIGSFREFFEQTGLADRLKSENPATANQAVNELMAGYFGDTHSSLVAPSPYTGLDVIIGGGNMSPSEGILAENQITYRSARDRAFPNGVPAYQEIGDTAYVTIDRFTPMPTEDYYETPPTADVTDTIGVIMYAHSQIMREDSPIENVVLDLSNCLGGEADTAIYTVAWFLGGATCISMNDTLTGAQATTKYVVDTNADGSTGPEDIVSSKNLFCLVSPVSFSCGNLVPACFKDSTKVTLVGKRTSGGACFVQPMSMADGTTIRLSGSWRMSSMSNGSYYDIDKGIEPDIPLARVDSFYDREELTSYLQGWMR